MSIIVPHLNEIRFVRIPEETDPRKYRYAVSAVYPLVDTDTNALLTVTDATLPTITERQAKEIDTLFKNYLRAFRKARIPQPKRERKNRSE